ncbi:hypothetical protein V8E36_004285 [Tilletia maclaganii]
MSDRYILRPSLTNAPLEYQTPCRKSHPRQGPRSTVLVTLTILHVYTVHARNTRKTHVSMVRTSPRQQVLRKVGAALVHSIEAHASAIRSRDADRACDSTTEDEDEDSLLDDSLAVDWDTEDVLGFFSDWDSDGDSASSVSSMSEDDDTEDDLSRHILLAARFYDSLSALRTLHPRRDKR